MIIEIDGKTPAIGKGVFIAPTACIIGDVEIRDGSSIWYGTVIRGDLERIVIGKNTNIQDNCSVHADPGMPTRLGDNASVGHNSVIHGCTVEDDCLVGMHATIMNKAIIRRGSIVAAGSVVIEGTRAGPFQLVAGAPAALKKALPQSMARDQIQTLAKSYGALAQKHRVARIVSDHP